MARLIHLKASAVELLEILLEETDERSADLAQAIYKDIHAKDFVPLVSEMWNCKKFRYPSKEQARRVVYRAFHIMCKLADYQGVTVEYVIGNPHICHKSLSAKCIIYFLLLKQNCINRRKQKKEKVFWNFYN